jgi:acetyl esterase
VTQEFPVLDHTIRAVIEGFAAHREPPIYELTPEEARKLFLRVQSEPVQQREAKIEDQEVNSEAGPLRLRTIRPVGAIDRNPVIMYFHGGGWVLGDATTHDRLARELAAETEATVVFVDYDRAPEYRYPVAIEQAYAATKYVSERAEELAIDRTRLAVAGESSGGNMATVVSLLARERSGPHIAGQLLLYPATSADFETPSYRQFAQGPWLTRRAMEWFWDQYLPDHTKRGDPHASPLLASLDQLAGLPSAAIITAENDVLRYEGEAYGRKLIQAGVEVVATRYNGTIHDFLTLDAMAQAAPTRAAMAQAVRFLRNVVSETPT